MKNDAVIAALAAFDGALTWAQYDNAKRLAGKCSRIDQLAMVDAIRDCYKRLKGTERVAA